MASYTFRTPPGWPKPPKGWVPAKGWLPDPSWPPAPQDWQFFEELPMTTGDFDLDKRDPTDWRPPEPTSVIPPQDVLRKADFEARRARYRTLALSLGVPGFVLVVLAQAHILPDGLSPLVAFVGVILTWAGIFSLTRLTKLQNARRNEWYPKYLDAVQGELTDDEVVPPGVTLSAEEARTTQLVFRYDTRRLSPRFVSLANSITLASVLGAIALMVAAVMGGVALRGRGQLMMVLVLAAAQLVVQVGVRLVCRSLVLAAAAERGFPNPTSVDRWLTDSAFTATGVGLAFSSFILLFTLSEPTAVGANLAVMALAAWAIWIGVSRRRKWTTFAADFGMVRVRAPKSPAM